MPFQFHAVMQQSEDIDHVVPLRVADAEYHEMPALAPVSCNMKRPDFVADFRPLFGPCNGGAGA